MKNSENIFQLAPNASSWETLQTGCCSVRCNKDGNWLKTVCLMSLNVFVSLDGTSHHRQHLTLLMCQTIKAHGRIIVQQSVCLYKKNSSNRRYLHKFASSKVELQKEIFNALKAANLPILI